GTPIGYGSRGISAGCGRLLLEPISRTRHCFCGGATLRRTRLTISKAGLWRSLGGPVDMGSAYPQPCVGDPQEPLLCGDVCFRPLPVSRADQRPGRSSETDASGGDARLASPFAGAPRGLYSGGRVLAKSRTFAEKLHPWRGDGVERPDARRLGFTARAVAMRSLWPGNHRSVYGQRWQLSHVSVQLVASRRARHQGLSELPL